LPIIRHYVAQQRTPGASPGLNAAACAARFPVIVTGSAAEAGNWRRAGGRHRFRAVGVGAAQAAATTSWAWSL